MKNTRTIPAELKREVLIESGHRCSIPTCRHTGNLEIHHIIPWEKCKKHEYDNLITLCPNCHTLAHDGKIDTLALKKYKLINQRLINTMLSNSEIEAGIKFNPNSFSEIVSAKNILSITDNGILDFTFNFEKKLKDNSYLINFHSDGTLNYVIVEKSEGQLRVKFKIPCPNFIKLEIFY